MYLKCIGGDSVLCKLYLREGSAPLVHLFLNKPLLYIYNCKDKNNIYKVIKIIAKHCPW